MLPLSLLKTAEGHPMLIELKNGDTYNGRLVRCDMFMNICLRDVICTSKDGDRFWKMPECYIRGSSIKYLRIPDDVISMVPEHEPAEKKTYASRGRGGIGGIGGRSNGGRYSSRGGPSTTVVSGRGGRGGERAPMRGNGPRQQGSSRGGGRDSSTRGRGRGAPPPGVGVGS